MKQLELKLLETHYFVLNDLVTVSLLSESSHVSLSYCLRYYANKCTYLGRVKNILARLTISISAIHLPRTRIVPRVNNAQ